MSTKKLLRRVLAHSFLATPKLRIVRFILASENSPLWMKRLVLRARNALPRKKVVTKIPLNAGEQAVLELDLNSYGDRAIFYGTYEPGVASIYQKIIREKRIVWDVGSNTGFYAVMAGQLLRRKGRVYAFEPVPMNFDALKKNVELNHLTNVHLFNVALSSEDCESEIYLLQTNRVTSSPTLDKEWAKQSNLNQRVRITTRSAKSLLNSGEVARPDLIKIDAESHEPIILGDLQDILMEENDPDIICEIMPPTIAPLQKLLMTQCCYACYHILPEGLKEVHDLRMRRPYNDYYFTKE